MTTSANDFYQNFVTYLLGEPEAVLEYHKRLSLLPEGFQEEIREVFQKQFPGVNLHIPPSTELKSKIKDKNQRFTFLSTKDAFKDPVPIDWVIEDLFSEGSVSIVFGEPGAKKTYAMLDACVCVALGKPWLGKEVTQGRALFIDEESGQRRIERRIRQVVRGHDGDDQIPLEYLTLEMFGLGVKADIETIINEINRRKVDFVVIDALADVTAGSDENSVQDMQPMMMNLRKMGESTKAAVIVIHHSNKGGKYRGSSALKGGVDLLLKVTSEKQSPLIKFDMEKARDTEEIEFAAKAHFSEDCFFLESADPSEFDVVKKIGVAETYVLKILSVNGNMLRKDILESPEGCSESSARNSIYTLVEKKYIQRIDNGARGTQATFGLTESGKDLCMRSGWLDDD